MDRVECLVVGAGVVGLAVASRLARRGHEVVIVERHDLIGSETSSRNSEVIHAGIYYPQGSLKARLCVAGKAQLYEYCEQFDVAHSRCGKLIVAVRQEQIATVEGYMSQAAANGVRDLVWMSAGEVNDLEPEVTSVGGVYSPSTGVVDSHGYMTSLLGELEQHGGALALVTPVLNIEHVNPLVVRTQDFEIAADWVINCAGLEAPRLVADVPGTPQAYYAKGHYYSYAGVQPFTHLVYPLAEQGGLGVHVTMDLAGQVKFGPDVRWIKHPDYAFDTSHFDDFVAAIQAYFPGLDPSRLHPSYTGIRPKIAPPEAGFVDFMIHTPADHGVAGLINLMGIESPGLTASLALADHVCGVIRAL